MAFHQSNRKISNVGSFFCLKSFLIWLEPWIGPPQATAVCLRPPSTEMGCWALPRRRLPVCPPNSPSCLEKQLFPVAELRSEASLLPSRAGCRGNKGEKLSPQTSKDGVVGFTFSRMPETINWGFGNSLREDVF